MTDGGAGNDPADTAGSPESGERGPAEAAETTGAPDSGERGTGDSADTTAGAVDGGPTPAVTPASEPVTDELPAEVLEYTTGRRSVSSLVQIHWGLRAGLVAVVAGVVLTAVLSNFGFPPEYGPLVVGVFVVLAAVWIGLRYRRWVYQVRGDALYLERGVVTHVRTLVPYVRIQHVDTSRGPLERTLGLSTLVVYTAGSRGADVSIPGLTPEEASDLQKRVKELAIEAEGGDAL